MPKSRVSKSCGLKKRSKHDAAILSNGKRSRFITLSCDAFGLSRTGYAVQRDIRKSPRELRDQGQPKPAPQVIEQPKAVYTWQAPPVIEQPCACCAAKRRDRLHLHHATVEFGAMTIVSLDGERALRLARDKIVQHPRRDIVVAALRRRK